MYVYVLERFSNECRKTKTKGITLANQKGRRQSSKPIETRSNYTQPSQSAGKCAHEAHCFVKMFAIIMLFSGTFCGVFRRQALDRGAMALKVDKIVTGALRGFS